MKLMTLSSYFLNTLLASCSGMLSSESCGGKLHCGVSRGGYGLRLTLCSLRQASQCNALPVGFPFYMIKRDKHVLNFKYFLKSMIVRTWCVWAWGWSYPHFFCMVIILACFYDCFWFFFLSAVFSIPQWTPLTQFYFEILFFTNILLC